MNQLAQGLSQAHHRALAERAADPVSRDDAAANRLAHVITSGNARALLSAAATPEGVEVLITIAGRAEVGGALSYQQATLGMCVRTRVTPGSPSGDVGERGTVTTEAVPCPDGVIPVVEDHPVRTTTTALERLSSPVPRPAGTACVSGSGDCPGG